MPTPADIERAKSIICGLTKYNVSPRPVDVDLIVSLIEAVRAERDKEWSGAARNAKEFADRVARSQVDKGFNKRYGMAPITEAMNIRDALAALIEEVK